MNDVNEMKQRNQHAITDYGTVHIYSVERFEWQPQRKNPLLKLINWMQTVSKIELSWESVKKVLPSVVKYTEKPIVKFVRNETIANKN